MSCHQSIYPNVPFSKIFLGKASWVPSIPWRFRSLPPEVSNGAMHLTYITADFSPLPGGLVSWSLYFKAHVEIFWTVWGPCKMSISLYLSSVAFFCISTRYQPILSSMDESRTTCMRHHNIQLLHISLLEEHNTANTLQTVVLVMAFQYSISIKTIQETSTIISLLVIVQYIFARKYWFESRIQLLFTAPQVASTHRFFWRAPDVPAQVAATAARFAATN